MAITTTTEAGRAVALKRADVTTPLAAPEREPAAENGKRPRPTTLDDAYPWLLKPFRQQDVEILAAATTSDKSRALCVAYADPRVYFGRLDQICGPANWSTELALGERGVVCRLTIFGVTRSAGGDYPSLSTDANAVTSAEAQAFKRACAAFGLGRYLYSMPQIWSAYDAAKKQVIDAAGIVRQMYASLERDP
jgi:hypothetical protein